MQGSDVSSHKLKVHSAFYTPVDSRLIPTGHIESVKGSPMDLQTGPSLDEVLSSIPSGLDLNYVLHTGGKDLRPLAIAPGVNPEERMIVVRQ